MIPVPIIPHRRKSGNGFILPTLLKFQYMYRSIDAHKSKSREKLLSVWHAETMRRRLASTWLGVPVDVGATRPSKSSYINPLDDILNEDITIKKGRRIKTA